MITSQNTNNTDIENVLNMDIVTKDITIYIEKITKCMYKLFEIDNKIHNYLMSIMVVKIKNIDKYNGVTITILPEDIKTHMEYLSFIEKIIEQTIHDVTNAFKNKSIIIKKLKEIMLNKLFSLFEHEQNYLKTFAGFLNEKIKQSTEYVKYKESNKNKIKNINDMSKILYKNWDDILTKLKNNIYSNNKVYNKSVTAYLSTILHKMMYINN